MLWCGRPRYGQNGNLNPLDVPVPEDRGGRYRMRRLAETFLVGRPALPRKFREVAGLIRTAL
jgi:hypothetical protein